MLVSCLLKLLHRSLESLHVATTDLLNLADEHILLELAEAIYEQMTFKVIHLVLDYDSLESLEPIRLEDTLQISPADLNHMRAGYRLAVAVGCAKATLSRIRYLDTLFIVYVDEVRIKEDLRVTLSRGMILMINYEDAVWNPYLIGSEADTLVLIHLLYHLVRPLLYLRVCDLFLGKEV